MKNYASMRLSIVSVFASVALMASAWGQKGHDATAYIAEQHLTPTAAAAIDSLLDGRSIVYWANWLDNASHNREFAYTKTWHYINIDADQTYETAPRNSRGDAVTAIRGQIKTLTDKHYSKADKQNALKILVHVTGDLHQPMHAGHATDLGGNKVTVKYFGSDKNLHSIWDTSLVESAHRWSYTEWQQQVDRANEVEQAVIISGNIDDWAKQSVEIARKVYEYFPEGKNVSYNQVADWSETIEEQFLRGGLRLAHILNLIFDPNYSAGNLITDPNQL